MTTRTPLRRDLADLKQKVYLLGEKCIEIANLYNSLFEVYSQNLEKTLIDTANEIKKESKELHEQCFLVLTLQQPLIRDLRFVIGSLQIVLNLVRISEQYSTSISLIQDVNILRQKLKDDLIKMSNKVHNLLNNSITLYLSSNLDMIDKTISSISEINFLHDVLYKQILNEVAQEGGYKAQIEAQLLSIIRSLEKVSDLTLNIIEQVKYIILRKSDEIKSKD